MSSTTWERDVLLPIVAAYFDENTAAKHIFESAEFKAATRFRAQQTQSDPALIDGEQVLNVNPENVMHLVVKGAEEARDLMKNIRNRLEGATTLLYAILIS